MKRTRKPFLESMVIRLANVFEQATSVERFAERGGLLQSLDPRGKIVGILVLIIAAVSVHKMEVTLGILATGVGVALASHITIWTLLTRIWLGVLAFTGSIAVPALFTTPGESIGIIPGVNWTMTSQGLVAALRLVARAETAATLAGLVVLSTPWSHLLKGLRVVGTPSLLVVILGMTHRYIFLLLQTARDLFEARRCRIVGQLPPGERRRLATANAGVLLGKTLQLGEEVFTAMQARGFRGEVFTLDEFVMRRRDWFAVLASLAITSLAFVINAT